MSFNDLFFSANLSALKFLHVNEANEVSPAVLNGNLVALCSDSTTLCFGFGIVRGVDVTGDKIYIITPEDSCVMKNIKTLVMGVIILPSTFYTTGGYYDGSHPYICRTVRRATTNVPKRAYKACRFLLKT